MTRILVLEDEPGARLALAERLRGSGYDVETMSLDAVDAATFAPHAIVTGLARPVGLAQALRGVPLVANASSLSRDELLVVIDCALASRRAAAEVAELRARLHRSLGGEVVGASPGIQSVIDVVEQIAPTRANVLIRGETGTGKELIAGTIHRRATPAAPLVKLHCARLPDNVMDRELTTRIPLVDGGTLFLAEIDALSPALQGKLLALLDGHRIIAATEFGTGNLRADLLERVAEVDLEIPPLRQRRGDVAPLALHFVERYARANGKPLTGVSRAALEVLSAYDWPGNVRELENAIERAAVLATGTQIEVAQLPPNVLPPPRAAGAPSVPGATLAELERFAIIETLKATGGSTSKAARMLGLSVRTIQYRLHDYDVRRAS